MEIITNKLELSRNDLGCVRDWIKEIFDISLDPDRIKQLLHEIPYYDGATDNEGEVFTEYLCKRFIGLTPIQIIRNCNEPERTQKINTGKEKLLKHLNLA